MQFLDWVVKWLRYSRRHPLQAIGVLIFGAVPLAVLHLFQRQIEVWEDDFLDEHGTRWAAIAFTGIVDFLARHPIWAITILALSVVLGALIHGYIATNPFFKLARNDVQPEGDTLPLNELLTDSPHKCSFCGFSFSLVPRPFNKDGTYFVTRANCPKCGNVDEVMRVYNARRSKEQPERRVATTKRKLRKRIISVLSLVLPLVVAGALVFGLIFYSRTNVKRTAATQPLSAGQPTGVQQLPKSLPEKRGRKSPSNPPPQATITTGPCSNVQVGGRTTIKRRRIAGSQNRESRGPSTSHNPKNKAANHLPGSHSA